MTNENRSKSITRYVRLHRSLKDSLWAILFAFMISFFSVIGFFMNNTSILSLNDMCVGVGIILLLTFLGAEVYLRFRDLLVNRLSKEKPEATSGDIKLYIRYLIITMIMWLPVLLAYYPGLFAYDVVAQIPQTMGTYNTHHPLIHTLLLHFFYYVIGEQIMGNYNRGMVCYTLFQMSILAMAVTYMHLFLYRMKVGRKSRIAILIFTNVFPIYSVLSISMTKDILFAAFFLVLFLCLCYWELMPDFFEKRHLEILYFFSAIGTVLFRNNGIYVLILLFIVMLFFLRGEKRKKFLVMSMISILFAMSLKGALKYGMHASGGTTNEMLSVPYQQLSYVYSVKKDDLSSNDIHEIESLIPNVQYYRLSIADPVKRDGQAWEHKGQFISLYFKMFANYPVIYIKAFLYNTMGYWYLFDTSNAEIYGYGLETRQGYLLTDTKEGFGVIHYSFFPTLESLYENLFSLNEYQKIPLLFILCSMALYVWAIVLCAFFAINLKRKQAILPLAFLLSFIITILAGPCALIRYAFPIISCIPPLYVVTFKATDDTVN